MRNFKIISVFLLLTAFNSNIYSQETSMSVVVNTSNSEENINFLKNLANYPKIDISKTSNHITLIKPDGEVIQDFDTAKFYAGLSTQEEVNEKTKNILGSKIAIITIDIENNILTLSVGEVVEGMKDIFEMNAMTMNDLDFKKNAALLDMKNKIAIYCTKNAE